jgi:hypothetical protein
MKPLFLIGAALMAGAGIYGLLIIKKRAFGKNFNPYIRRNQRKQLRLPLL